LHDNVKKRSERSERKKTGTGKWEGTMSIESVNKEKLGPREFLLSKATNVDPEDYRPIIENHLSQIKQ
jgi:hypothetical protein